MIVLWDVVGTKYPAYVVSLVIGLGPSPRPAKRLRNLNIKNLNWIIIFGFGLMHVKRLVEMKKSLSRPCNCRLAISLQNKATCRVPLSGFQSEYFHFFSLAQSNGQHAIHWWRRLVSLHKNANQIAELAVHLHIQTTQVFDRPIQSKWKDFRRRIRAGSRRFQGQTSAVQQNLFKESLFAFVRNRRRKNHEPLTRWLTN